MLNQNKVEAIAIVSFAQHVCYKLYSKLTNLANLTIKNVDVYLKLFSITDYNQGRLAKS